MKKRSEIIFLFLAVFLIGFVSAGVYINEVEFDVSGTDTGNEWVEVYNDGTPVDLTGWYVTDKADNKFFFPSVMLNDFYVLDGLNAFVNAAGDNVSLFNSTDDLIDNTGLLVDNDNDAMTWQRIPDGTGNFVFQIMTKNKTNLISNTPESSTMIFEGSLMDDGDGTYSGTIDAVSGDYYLTGDGCTEGQTPDGSACVGGWDVYAKVGGNAYYDDAFQGVIGIDHDAYSQGGGWGSFWDPDVPDWNHYQLTIDGDNWYLEYKGSALGTPMSGEINWNQMYASETGTGSYRGVVPNDVDANDGDAAANGGGSGAWDMDWTWGSEVIPLEYPGFDITIEDIGGDEYKIIFVPAQEPEEPVEEPQTGKSVGIDVDISTEEFKPRVWMCDNRVVYDDYTEPGRNIYLIEEETIILAADRIIDLQHTDGSWDWVVTNQVGPTGTTYRNIAGVTAEVLLDAYKLTGETKYLNAAKDTGDYILSFAISKSNRYNAFNILFLYNLYGVSGDVTYKNHADDLMNHVLHEENYWTNNNGNHCGNDGCEADELLDALKDFRSWSTNPTGIVVWDLHTFIEASKRAGENAFVTDMANELDSYMSQAGFDDSIDYYELGLSGGIIALHKAGLDYSNHLNDLLSEQNIDGSFGSSEPIQTTAYAIMALKLAGEKQAAEKAANYLEGEFGYLSFDGWLEGGIEYSEVTSEAAQALFDYAKTNELLERINNYAFEGEKISWDVLVMDKNKIDQNIDVYATVGHVDYYNQGAGNPIEVNCERIEPKYKCNKWGWIREEKICVEWSEDIDTCNARIDQEYVGWNEDTMAFFRCTLTVETPTSMYGEHWITVEAKDWEGNMGTMDENEYWYLNPMIALSVDGSLNFNNVRPGTDAYSKTLLIENDADEDSGVMLDMFISGTDFYDSSSSGARCPTTNQLALQNFKYYVNNGAYSSHNDIRSDLEGYIGVNYGIGFNDPQPFYDNNEILQVQQVGPYYTANLLAPGAEMALTFKLSMPEPCTGDFDTGEFYFWGEAI